jgi:hypothetical protein
VRIARDSSFLRRFSEVSSSPQQTAMATIKKGKKPAEEPKKRLVLVRGPVVNWTCGERRDTSSAYAIGVSGLFIATKEPLPVGEQVQAWFDVPGGEVRARAVVRAAMPGRGMTIEYAPMNREDRANLQALVKYLPAYTEETAPAAPQPSDASGRGQRRYPRITLAKGMKVAWQCDGRRETAVANTIGQGGLFIVTSEPPPLGSTVRLLFHAGGGEVLTSAAVRDSRAGKGMGVEFLGITDEQMQRLTNLLAGLLLGGGSEAAVKSTTPADSQDEGAKRRRYKRVELPRGLVVAWNWEKQSEMSIAPTVARGGMFIATLDPPPAGSNLRLLFEVPGGEILAAGVVRDSRPGRGMGVEFTQMGPQEITRLEGLLSKLLA